MPFFDTPPTLPNTDLLLSDAGISKETWYSTLSNVIFIKKVGWDSVVCIAPCYELDGPGIESGWGWDFLTCSDQPWGLPILLDND
jgi:hypothetical protein